MNRSIRFWFVLASVLTLAVAAATCPALAGEKAYLMKGKVAAVDLSFHTIVIEVPLGQKRFTVGGPLSPDAVLTRSGRPAKLGDYQVGEWVSVVWHPTPAGHVIDKLEAP